MLMGKLLRRTPYLKSRASYTMQHAVSDEQFLIPIVNGQGFRHFARFETETFAIMKALHAQSPGAFVDVGANIGQTLIKVKAIDRSARYVGFEPSPACCGYLDQLINANAFVDCTVFPVGASDRQDILHFFYSHSTDAAATTVAGFWTGANTKSLCRSIIVERADVLIRQLATIEKIGVIKIDVEGGELEALSGLSETVAEHRPPILMEILPATCDFDAKYPDTGNGVKLRLDRIARLTKLLDDMLLVSYRLEPDGSLLRTREFDRDVYVPQLSNYVLIHQSSNLNVDQLSVDFRKELTGRTIAH